jgi:membrane fusion protein (multidrug efflux system)
MFASVEIATGKPISYLTLPQTAISYNPYGEIAYIVKEKAESADKKKDKDQKKNKDKDKGPTLIAHQTFVTVGDSRGDQVAVLKGINEGDLVVTSGQLKLKNGSTVIINNKVVPSNNPSPQIVDD